MKVRRSLTIVLAVVALIGTTEVALGQSLRERRRLASGMVDQEIAPAGVISCNLSDGKRESIRCLFALSRRMLRILSG